MKISRSALSLLIGFLAAGSPAFAQRQGVTWRATDTEPNSCMLRQEGAGPDRVVLEWIPGSNTATIWLISPRIPPRGRDGRRWEVIFQPGGEAIRVELDLGELDGRLFFGAVIESSLMRRFLSARTIRIRRPFGTITETSLPGDDAAVADFRACADRKMRAWGVDPEILGALRREPQPVLSGPETWFKSGDYPPSELREHGAGTTTVRAGVGLDGRVADCTIVLTSGRPVLDATTCDILRRRGRYVPALDPNGAPVATPIIFSVKWQLRP